MLYNYYSNQQHFGARNFLELSCFEPLSDNCFENENENVEKREEGGGSVVDAGCFFSGR